MKTKHPLTACGLLAFVILLFAAALPAWADYPAAVTNLNPVGYWRLNEPVSTNVASLVTGTATNYGSVGAIGNGRYMSITNVGVYPSAVAGDTAPFFNAGQNYTTNVSSTPDYLEMDHIPQLLTNFSMSIECWVLRTNIPVVGTVMSGGADTSAGNDYRGFVFFCDNNGASQPNTGAKNYYCRIRTTTGGTSNDFANVNCTVTQGLTPGHWDHVVYAWSTNHVICYVDGLPMLTNNFAAGKWYTPSTLSTQKIRLGGSANATPSTILENTWLAHAAIYPYELTAAQVANHYAATNSSATYTNTILADGPVGYWPLNESGPFAPPSALVPITCTNLGSWGTNANASLAATTIFNTGAAGVPYPGFGGATCATFPGGNNAVIIPPQPLAASSFSFSLWLKLAPGYGAVVYSRPFDSPTDIVTGHCGFAFGPSGSPGMQYNQIGAQLTGTYNGGSTPLLYAPSNQWVFVTMVADTNQTILYLNGLAGTNTDNTTTLGAHDFSLNNMVIGAGSSWSISDVAVFDYALTPAQVASLYAAAGVPTVTNTVAVTPPDGNGNFVISGTAGRGQTATLWMSTDLTLGQAGWTQVNAANGDAVTGDFSFTNNVGAGPQAFYRLK